MKKAGIHVQLVMICLTLKGSNHSPTIHSVFDYELVIYGMFDPSMVVHDPTTHGVSNHGPIGHGVSDCGDSLGTCGGDSCSNGGDQVCFKLVVISNRLNNLVLS